MCSVTDDFVCFCSDMAMVSLAAQSLTFATGIELMAMKVLKRLLSKSPDGFNGVHLRIEGDAKHAGYFTEISGTDSAKVGSVCP